MSMVSFVHRVLILMLTGLFLFPTSSRAASWEDTAKAWEESARKLHEYGDVTAEREAWQEAALAWEKAADVRKSQAASAVEPSRLDELELASRNTREELALWKSAVTAWREVYTIWKKAGDAAAAKRAQASSSLALVRVVELEEKLESLTARLTERRTSIIDMPVSEGLQTELMDRWAEVARSWEATALMWEQSGDPSKARIARIKAEEARGRMRELTPGVDETALAEATAGRKPTVDTPPVEPRTPADGGAAPAAIPSPAPTETAPTAAEIEVPVEDASPAADVPAPAPTLVEVPEIAPRPALPPSWLLTRDERDALQSAQVWRQSAEAWRKTALTRAADKDWDAAADAVSKMRAASSRAMGQENDVRWAYAVREAEIAGALARASGEAPKTETDVLALLDAADKIREVPPVLTGDAIAMTPPGMPEAAPTEKKERGFLDLEIGGPIPSTLSIRGRKVVDVSYAVTSYPNKSATRTDGQTQSNFNLNQELQVEVSGMVGRPDFEHININIRYDDTQRGVNAVNNRTIGVDYVTVPHVAKWGTWRVDPRFGDIGVSLGGSEFAFYNKSLFGVKAEASVDKLALGPLKANRVGMTLFGSQTKGVSASKEFSLSGERIIEDIKDINFARDRYFRIEPDTTNIPLADVVVYRDDRIGSNDEGTIAFTSAGAGQTAGFSHFGQWTLLTAGIDYTLNLVTGELELLNSLSGNDVLSVGYAGRNVSYGKGAIPFRLIRVSSDTSITSRQAFRNHDFRNRYLLSRRRIKKDDPKLVFEIRDALGFTQSDTTGINRRTYLQLFGLDKDNDDKVDLEVIDYDFGLIRPLDSAPFGLTGNPLIDNLALYQKDEVTDADKKYTIHIEYTSDQPQEIFTIGFDVLKGSDIVYVDGVKLERDRDYFIDYEAGVITFLNQGLLQSNSKIRVDYEFLPFGGQFERTIVGGRVDADVNQYLRFGSTLLYDFSAPAQEVPDIFEDKPNKNVVFEIDGGFSVAPFLFGFLDATKFGQSSPFIQKLKQNWRLDMNGEFAWAAQEPNTFGSAVVENFEEIENIVSASFGQTSWAPASRSTGLGLSLATRAGVSISLRDNFGHLSDGQVQRDERQTSLQFAVNFEPGETWVSIRQPLSSAAIDFADMTALELFISNLPSSVRLYVDAGLVSEDADEDGILDSEDNGLDGAAGTRDAGENNGVLNSGEDIGINIGGRQHGVNDGALTTEDMDGDFAIDQREAFFRFSDTSLDAETKVITGTQNSVWTLLRVPWRSGRVVGDADSRVIKHLRLTFVRQPGFDSSINFLMDQLSFRGSRFVGVSGDTRLALLPRNNTGDPNYRKPPLDELKQDKDKLKEQALALKWNLAANDSITVIQKLTKRIDLGDYRRLSFFLAGDARNETFSLILVSDPSNYIEIRRRVSTGTNLFDGVSTPNWERINIPLEQIQQATINNVLGRGDSTFTLPGDGVQITVVGRPDQQRSPTVTNINEIWLRVHAGNTADSGEFWLNDIYVAEPVAKSGMAKKLAFATGWGDLFSLSGNWRDVPGTYKGVGFINNPQTNTYDEISTTSHGFSWNLAFSRLLPSVLQKFISLPLSGNWGRSITQVDPNKVENTLKSSLGKTVSENQSYSTSLQLWKLPSVSLSYGNNRSIVDFRLEDRRDENSNLSASTGYGYSFPRKLFGIIPTGEQLSFNTSYNFSQQRSKSEYATVSGFTDVNARTATQGISFSANARPFNPLSLTYNFGTSILDRKTMRESERWKGITGRVHSLSSSLAIPSFFGISPGMNFSGNYNENFYRATFGGRHKDAALGGNFSINVGLDPSRWSKLLSFLSARYNYNLSSSASYRTMNTGTSMGEMFGDYVGERLFPWGSPSRIGSGAAGVTGNRSSGSTNISHNLSGDIKTWDWLRTSYSASFSRNEVASLSTLSISDGISGNMNMGLDYMQAFPRSFIKFRSSYISAAIGYSQSENAASRSNSISPSMNWSMSWTDALNMTFSMGYSRSSSLAFSSPGQKSTSTSLTPSMNWTYYFDLPLEKLTQLKLGKLVNIEKRVQLSGGFNGSLTESRTGAKRLSDQNRYGYNLGLGYRLSSNLDLGASSTGSWFQDRLEKTNDNFSLGGSARVEWRF